MRAKLKKAISILLVCLVVAACQWSSASTLAPTLPAQNTPVPTAAQTIWLTPVITATPIRMAPETEEEIASIVEEHYKINPQCKIDILNTREANILTPDLEFMHSNVVPDPQSIWVFEIADNPSKSLRAFTACEQTPCHPGLFIENLDNSTVQEINWSGRVPGRPIKGLMWIGDDLLSFSHLTSPHDSILGTVRITGHSFLFYWLAGYPCQ